MNKAYERINWENYPSDATPLNEANLNKLDSATDTLDDRVITLETTKATKTEVATLVADVTFEESTGIITITKKNGSKVTIDTQMEKIAVNFDYDPTTQQIILALIDGTKQYIDLSALITQYEFLDTDTVAFIIGTDGKVSAIVKEGSIEEKHLEPNYLAKIKVESAKAQASQESAATSAINAASSATAAESYAIGGTGTRDGEDADNAKYYSEQAKSVYDEMQKGQVTGVKGATQTDYQTGDVELTLENFIQKSGINNSYTSSYRFCGNVDDLKQGSCGVYWVYTGDATGTQPISNGYYVLEVICPNAGVIIQKAHVFSDCKTYYRIYTNNKWYDWHYCAETTTKAEQDGDGNVITDTYLPKSSVVNNNTTTEEGIALDARQANPNIEGSLAAQISVLSGKSIKCKYCTCSIKPSADNYATLGYLKNESVASCVPEGASVIAYIPAGAYSNVTSRRMGILGITNNGSLTLNAPNDDTYICYFIILYT